ncbi:hypothetical protein [Baekduia soli]|uniref:hypothetical protein n=1 Tax=Baekduia soli TaxID=496014 RepID=UPI001651FB8A|nr:hypothetical protein [Baekduia soli]
MGLAAAGVFACGLWIILWGIDFGRTGDAFLVTVPPIMFIAVMVHAIRAKRARQRP